MGASAQTCRMDRLNGPRLRWPAMRRRRSRMINISDKTPVSRHHPAK